MTEQGSREIITPTQEKLNQLSLLGDKFLESGTNVTRVWKKASFAIPGDDLAEFHTAVMESSIGRMFKGLKGYKPSENIEEYPTEMMLLDTDNPDAAGLMVQNFGPYDDIDTYRSIEYTIVFVYENSGHPYYLEAKLVNGVSDGYKDEGAIAKPYNYWTFSSLSYQEEESETGYEGSSGKEEEIELEDATLFLELFQQKTKHHVKDKTLHEHMAEQKLVNSDTNEVFYFDPARGDFFSESGVALPEDKSPIANIPLKEGQVLKSMGSYEILALEEGEVNPFLKNQDPL